MEVKVNFRNHDEQVLQCCHSFKIRYLSVSPNVDLEGYEL